MGMAYDSINDKIYFSDDSNRIKRSNTDGSAVEVVSEEGRVPFISILLNSDDDENPLPEDVDDDEDGFTENQGDCNDNDDGIYPGAEDVCGDGIDQDCNGSDCSGPDDVDNDEDGFTENEGDCNDEDDGIHPGAKEICGDGIDQDCDGIDCVCQEFEFGQGNIEYYIYSDGRSWDFTATESDSYTQLEVQSRLGGSGAYVLTIQISVNDTVIDEWTQSVTTTYTDYSRSDVCSGHPRPFPVL